MKDGYDIDRFLQVPSEELLCPICQGVFNKPKQTPCLHVFCQHCITTWISSTPSCPVCVSHVTSNQLINAPYIIGKMVDSLNITCQFQGCNKVITVGELSHHEANCSFSRDSKRTDFGSHNSQKSVRHGSGGAVSLTRQQQQQQQRYQHRQLFDEDEVQAERARMQQEQARRQQQQQQHQQQQELRRQQQLRQEEDRRQEQRQREQARRQQQTEEDDTTGSVLLGIAAGVVAIGAAAFFASRSKRNDN